VLNDVFKFCWAHFSAGCTAMTLSPASVYVHVNVHCVNFFCILFCTCYLVFVNKMEWNGIAARSMHASVIATQFLTSFKTYT